jgi:photosystem II stability/assembly factor-like uncharacterized protein
VDANTGWIRLYYGGWTLLFTSNGGRHWTQQSLADSYGGRLDGISFTDINNGWAVGQCYTCQPSLLFHTMDGGTTWSSTTISTSSKILFPNVNTGFLIGSGATFVDRTLDGGATWTRVYDGSLGSFYGAHGTALDPNIVTIFGGARIIRTTTGAM